MESSRTGSQTQPASATRARGPRPRSAQPAPVGPDPADDDLAIDEALAGDSAAFGRLVVKYQDRLYNSLLRYTGSPEDAQDVAQDAFVQAFLKLGSFKRNSAFFTWLYRIAFNRAASNARKRRERTSLDGLTEAGAPQPTDQHAPPEAAMIAQEHAELVRQAVAELADDQRQVVVLREFDGFDYQQISDVLEIPIGTVRSRLFRARMQMKERLAAILGEAQDALPRPDLGAQP
ncbi:ECF RNA polymerase sigma-E factor [Posidoniimonas corsicana]|uniref:RNA polymerase sigma factor n=1 Tax=Posidoniimonas corsicana TaxID=1938618 RepID=A0A5C5UVY5_9BACT|nr:sigma-70 family RNA polymerase sigma factor [Posidoniimonas corsicana]TWT29572.1 ECF RNA polymerase sigma-E factor [Posidoniimonas corsicana]